MDEVFGEGKWASQFLVEDKWTVDACVPALKIVVQADGDYWHGFLAEYRDHPMVKKNMANDARQGTYLGKAGWTLLRLWEHDLLEDLETCRRRLVAIRDCD